MRALIDFGHGGTFDTRDRRAQHRVLRPVAARVRGRARPAPVHAAHPAREPRCAAGTRRVRARSPRWDADAEPSHEVAFSPARVLLQDFTGVPAVVDLAAMREAVAELGGDSGRRRPPHPGRPRDRPLGAGRRVRLARGRSRATSTSSSSATASATRFLRWGQDAFGPLKVVPPGTGICHQVNLEYLARVVEDARRARLPRHARRHRLPHDDGQRPRRARLGRRRDRGGGGDARRAALAARAAGGRRSGCAARCARASRRPTSSSP